MDWKKLLTDLIADGMTQRAIGDEIGLSQGAISQLLAGHIETMEWTKGEKLRELHNARFSNQSAAA